MDFSENLTFLRILLPTSICIFGPIFILIGRGCLKIVPIAAYILACRLQSRKSKEGSVGFCCIFFQLKTTCYSDMSFIRIFNCVAYEYSIFLMSCWRHKCAILDFTHLPNNKMKVGFCLKYRS